jgi:protein phosphatase
MSMESNAEVGPPPALPKVAVAVASEQGRREENQDWYSWTQTDRGELFVIADGMGGYKGGALAAKMTVEIVEKAMSEAPAQSSFAQAVTEALIYANHEVHRVAHSGNPDTENMGSTALVMLLSDGNAQIAHVGDSRAYLLRNNKLQLLTRDHTRVQQMVDANMLTPEQARTHPDNHLLSRAIGSRPEVEVEVSQPLPLNKGDSLLLCSDGLSGFVSDEQIRGTIRKQRDIQQVPHDLVNLALNAGGNDNITIQFVRVDGTVRERITATMPVGTIIAQGRSRDALLIVAKRTGVAVLAVAAVGLVVTGVLAYQAPSFVRPTVTVAYDDTKEILRWESKRAASVEFSASEQGKPIETVAAIKEKNNAPEGQAPLKRSANDVHYEAVAKGRFFVWPVETIVTVNVPAADRTPAAVASDTPPVPTAGNPATNPAAAAAAKGPTGHGNPAAAGTAKSGGKDAQNKSGNDPGPPAQPKKNGDRTDEKSTVAPQDLPKSETTPKSDITPSNATPKNQQRVSDEPPAPDTPVPAGTAGTPGLPAPTTSVDAPPNKPEEPKNPGQ